MPSRQLTLREQLGDPIFRKWFMRNPQLSKNWRVYIQKEEGGPWTHTDVASWKEGYELVAKKLKKVHDISLNHKLKESNPPVVKKLGKRAYYFPDTSDMDLVNHHWCTFCRRMTKFAYFKKHHNLPPYLNPAELRCRICGVRYAFIRKF